VSECNPQNVPEKYRNCQGKKIFVYQYIVHYFVFTSSQPQSNDIWFQVTQEVLFQSSLLALKDNPLPTSSTSFDETVETGYLWSVCHNPHFLHKPFLKILPPSSHRLPSSP